MKHLKVVYFALIAAVVLAGCDLINTYEDDASRVQLQMRAKTNDIAAKAAQNVLTIEEVKFFVEELELDGTWGTEDFELENFIVNLPLDGTPLVLTEKTIPAGYYDEFEMEIEKPDDDVYIEDRDFRDETGKYSVVVKGTFNNEDFTFRSREDFEIEIDLKPPLKIEEGETSILVISIDVTSWFKGKDGEYLDPKDYRNTERINDNIEKSFEAFEDKYDDDDDDDDDDPNFIHKPEAGATDFIFYGGENPFGNKMTFSVEITTSTDLIIRISDLNGKTIRDIKNNNMNTGRYDFSINTTGWQQGMYLLQLNSSQSVKTIKMVKH